MKGVGSSYGITTEFLYRVYTRPETLPVFFFVFVETPYDLKRLEALINTGKYSYIINRLTYIRPVSFALENIVSLFFKVPSILHRN